MSKSFIVMFCIAAFISVLARLRLISKKPEEIKRKKDGSIDWIIGIYITTLELIVGGVVGVSVGVALIHYNLVSGDMLFLCIAMSGLAAGKIFDKIQDVIHKNVESINEDDIIKF